MPLNHFRCMVAEGKAPNINQRGATNSTCYAKKMSISAEHASNQIMWSVQALACPAGVQLKLFPDFTHKPDELVLDFENWYQATKWRDDVGMTSKKLEALAVLDSFMEEMPPERFDEKFVIAGEDWEQLRDLARQTLAVCDWPLEAPPMDRAVYIKSQ